MYRSVNVDKQFMYTDLSQHAIEDADRAAAQQVMQYRDFKVLAAATASSGWSKHSSSSFGRLKKWLRPMEEVSKTRRWDSSTSQSFFKPPAEDEEIGAEDMVVTKHGTGMPNASRPQSNSDGASRLLPREGPDYDFTSFRPDGLRKSSSLPRVPISSVFGRPNSEQGSYNDTGLRQSASRGSLSTPIFAGSLDPQTSIRELKFRPPIMMFDRR
jgi:hypothetical protein